MILHSVAKSYFCRIPTLPLVVLVGFVAVDCTLAKADDFTVDSPTSSQNGGGPNVLNGNDSLTITRDGSITFGGGHGVIATGGNNSISNNGTISTTGTNNRAINVTDGNTISNSGLISTTGDQARGVFANDNNTISNSGAISTLGVTAQGIRAVDGNTIVNSGSINTEELRARGIYVSDNNMISNSGTIVTLGDVAQGIRAVDGNTIINSGSISTAGEFSRGIFAGDNNTITHSGTISTTGATAPGIRVDNNSTVNVSGSIIATNSVAILFASANNTLNITTSSFVGGAFNLGANARLNINANSSHSILWTFDTTQLAGGVPNITGSGPVFQIINGTTLQIATFDPVTFAGSKDAMVQLTGSLSGLMQQRLEGNGAELLNSGLSSFVSTQESKSRIDKAFDEGSSSYAGVEAPDAWLSVFGSRSSYDGTVASQGYDIFQWGVAGGYDWSPSADFKFGFMLGYFEQEMSSDSGFASSYDDEGSGFFAGFYGRKNLNETVFVDFALTGGISDYSQQRVVNDNLAPLGVASANGDHGGYWISPEIAIGTKFDLKDDWVASPLVRLRYASQWIDGYTETGTSASNSTVGSRQVAIGEASVEFAVSKQTEKGVATLRVGYLYNTTFGNGSVNITMLGQTLNIPNFARDRGAGYLGANASVHLSDMLDLEFGGKAILGRGFTSLQGNLRLVAKF